MTLPLGRHHQVTYKSCNIVYNRHTAELHTLHISQVHFDKRDQMILHRMSAKILASFFNSEMLFNT